MMRHDDVIWIEYTYFDGYKEMIPVSREIHEWRIAQDEIERQPQGKAETPPDQH